MRCLGNLIMYIRYQVITIRTSSSTGVQIDGSTNAPHTFVKSYLRVRRVTQTLKNTVITSLIARLRISCYKAGLRLRKLFQTRVSTPTDATKYFDPKIYSCLSHHSSRSKAFTCHFAGSQPSSNYSEMSRRNVESDGYW